MKYTILLAAAVALIVLLVACKDDGGGGEATTPAAGVTATNQQGVTPTQTGTTIPEPKVCQPNPDPATPEFQVIDQPSSGKTVTSPVTISGQVLAFEGTYQVGIFDSTGSTLALTFGTAEATEIGELAPFSIDVPFEVDGPTPACIWVYELSARDGSQINIGQIPVLLSP